jgi:von Willebrand factor A domain-containing protein 8
MLRQRRLIRKTRLLNSRRLHEPHSSLVFSEEMRGHLRWIEQKYQMGQDMILLGLPTSLKRRLVAQIAELNGWDIEYLAITRDTTESDLKQRREIVGNTVVYTDQPPVRAAINGSILILDGIENAERNVLPTLNNLLENREMSLDDVRGSTTFLLSYGLIGSISDEATSKPK